MASADDERRDRRAAARSSRRRRVLGQRAVVLVVLSAAAASALAVLTGGDGSRRTAVGRQAPAHGRRASRARPASTPVVVSRPAFSVRGAAARRMRIPILMYHVVSAARPGTPNPELWVAPERFRAELQALRRHGFAGITLHEAHAAWSGAGALPPHPVVISFDDGYLSHYTHAAPVLKALGWPGVLNLELHNIGPGGLTTHQLKRLVHAGWELDSHTIDHPDLTTLGPQELRRQLVVSRREIRRRFGAPVDFFCYPSGRVNDTVAAAVEAAGYVAATTTVEGLASGPQRFHLARVRVNGSDTAASLLARLRAERGAR